jgi:hypothetical protein
LQFYFDRKARSVLDPFDVDRRARSVLDSAVIHDVMPADALRGSGRASALIMRAGLPTFGPE